MSDAITRLNAALEGRYTIEREFGEGGMATVYLATRVVGSPSHSISGRLSAVPVPPPCLSPGWNELWKRLAFLRIALLKSIPSRPLRHVRQTYAQPVAQRHKSNCLYEVEHAIVV